MLISDAQSEWKTTSETGFHAALTHTHTHAAVVPLFTLDQ